MGTLSLTITNAGRQELYPPRLARIITKACLGIKGLGLKPDDIRVEYLGKPISDGQRIPLEIEIGLFSGNDASEECVVRHLARTIGQTAKQLYSENGWPPRKVEVRVAATNVSWSG